MSTNTHGFTFPKFQFVKKCGHAAISKREKKSITWLKKGFPALVALEDVVSNQKLLKDLAELHHTGQLESYHSLMTKYVPKREHFRYNGMVARTQLAILDHNANTTKSQAEVKKTACQGKKVQAGLFKAKEKLGCEGDQNSKII